jgi:uncharacterized membrane protein
MISDFITTYYIDPIRYGQPYNIVDTLTYAIILVIGDSHQLIYGLLRTKASGLARNQIFCKDASLFPITQDACIGREELF